MRYASTAVIADRATCSRTATNPSSGKEPERVKARSVAAYWAVQELGLAGTEVGKELNLTQSAVSRSVRRGEEIVKELGLCMVDEGKA
jgi:hypothetical protein